jgi:BirA family biotin operon repressor/biotin-[acetyl-CoA-carboxylase] ligase
MSLILRNPPSLLSLAAGIAVAETALTFGSVAVAIKWPNDVWVGGAKLAGILVEARPQENWAVLGIGVNVSITREDFPEELQGRATSLGLAPGARRQVLAVLLERLGFWTTVAAPAVLDAVRARDALWRRAVSWAGGTGVGAGIDHNGKLLVDTVDGRVALDAGEVHLRLD